MDLFYMDLGYMWQVQKHLQLRIEAQGKYMQSILEKAYQTLAGENMASAAATNLKGVVVGPQGGNHIPDNMGLMKEFGSPALSFSSSFQDLDIYGGGGDQIDLQQNMDKQSPLDGFLPINNDNLLCLGGNNKKRPNNNNPFGNNGKSPLMWSDDLRLQDLGTASSCLQDHDLANFKGDQIQIAPPGDIDTMAEIYDSKPVVLQGEEKKFDASSLKLERPSPRRAPFQAERNMSPMISTGTMAQGRNSPFG